MLLNCNKSFINAAFSFRLSLVCILDLVAILGFVIAYVLYFHAVTYTYIHIYIHIYVHKWDICVSLSPIINT